jgi:hypothetical protein
VQIWLVSVSSLREMADGRGVHISMLQFLIEQSAEGNQVFTYYFTGTEVMHLLFFLCVH